MAEAMRRRQHSYAEKLSYPLFLVCACALIVATCCLIKLEVVETRSTERVGARLQALRGTLMLMHLRCHCPLLRNRQFWFILGHERVLHGMDEERAPQSRHNWVQQHSAARTDILHAHHASPPHQINHVLFHCFFCSPLQTLEKEIRRTIR